MYFVASPLKHLTCSDPASEVKSPYLLRLRCAGAGEWQTRGAGSCRFPLTSSKGSVIIEHSRTWNLTDLGSGSGRAFSPLNQSIKVQFIYCKKNGDVDHHSPIQSYLRDIVGSVPDHSNQESHNKASCNLFTGGGLALDF